MERRGYLRNVASNWSRLVVSIFVGLVMTPLFIRYLGKSTYGVWLLIHSVVGYYGLLDLGIRSAVVRYVSRDLARADLRAVNETLNTSLVLYSGIGLAALGVSGALAAVLPSIEGFAAARHPHAGTLILLVGAAIAVSFPGRLLEGVLSAAERFTVSNGIGIVFSLMRNGVFLAVLLLGGGLMDLAWVLLIETVVHKLVTAIVVLRQVPGLRISPGAAARHRVRQIFGYGIHTFLAQAGDRLRLYTDSIVIGAFLPAQAITLFNVGNRPLNYLSRITLGISRVLTPAFSRTEASNGETELRRLLVVGTRSTALLAALICLVLALSGERLIRLWVGEGFSESVTVLLILVPAYLLAASQTPVNSILYGTSRHQLLSRLTLAEGVVNLGLSLWWVQLWGIAGVALGTALPMIVVRFVLLPLYACRTVGLTYAGYLGRSLGPAVPALVVTAVAGWLLRSAVPGVDLLSVAALVGAIVGIYGLVALATLYVTRDALLPERWRRSGRHGA
ncbi:MAG: oligosaccharide flippase family protein [Candidatus Eisenbacteria bacterium]|nr:oligosaccharide flippase family protein [Candidatus Eisenbacteria bacterium]